VTGLLVIVVVVVAWMLLITVAARDMDARGCDGRLYGLAMILLPVGLVLWLVGRSRHPRVAQ
jgi:hypothetical protein